ncbi:hypothetical protein IDJ77_12190 [Mucilaginibacter sp. ZT4R22]|uniref:Uncharacterized protein n=1 Tax=Mucilaginibacter pankratovii TaxID=2772110 RepID=A0ABR7WQI0_9SPHI|nr:hypothetical protein [Mucilaginibacter pankratovii]MBD1364570.1 hypothetical protein [Mucilaginibacter pankratovii]
MIVGFFLYGQKLIKDKTEIAQTKKALLILRDSLDNCKLNLQNCSLENKTKEGKISEQQADLKNSSIVALQRDSIITQLNDSIVKLTNKPPEIIVQYRDRVFYKDRPEPYHPYGKGYGKLTIFKRCNCYKLRFKIDGEYAGTISQIFSVGDPVCGQEGTISRSVLAGKHHVEAQDNENHLWNFYIIVNEDQCLIKGLSIN